MGAGTKVAHVESFLDVCRSCCNLLTTVCRVVQVWAKAPSDRKVQNPTTPFRDMENNKGYYWRGYCLVA